MPQLELAKLVGVSRQTIYYLEKGTYNPSLTVSFRISEIFGKPIEEIFYFEPVIKDLMGSKTLDELDEIAEITRISKENVRNIRDLTDNELSEKFSENDLIKISEALGVEFEDLFLKEEVNED